MSEPESARQKVLELNALPIKDVLKNKARVCPPLSAICEIMDNIFDNFEENGAQRNLAISFIIKTKHPGEISIAENSGGIRDVKLEPLVRLGVSYHSAKGSIGIWGEGLKVAAFSLGSEVGIFTLVIYGWGKLHRLPLEQLENYTAFKDRMLQRPVVRKVLEREQSLLLQG